MPTYEYVCGGGHRYEKQEGFDALPRQKCPTCRRAANRVLFAPPVVFKGSGFYKTDNRGGESSSADAAPSTAPDATPAPAAAEPAAHGHSHGAGGHTHGDAKAPGTAATETAAAT